MWYESHIVLDMVSFSARSSRQSLAMPRWAAEAYSEPDHRLKHLSGVAFPYTQEELKFCRETA